MQNYAHIYERINKNVFDLFSEIGGVAQFLFYIFFWINFIYNKYIVAYDTYSLFFFVQDEGLNYKKGLKSIFFNMGSISNDDNSKRYSYQSFRHKNNLQLENNNQNNNNNKINNGKIKIKKFAINNFDNKSIKINTEYNKNDCINSNKNINNQNFLLNNRLNNDENCSNDILKLNSSILVNRLNKANNTKIDKNKNLTLDEINKNKRTTNIIRIYNKKKTKNNNDYINKIMVSQKSIGRIEHNKKKFKIIMNKEHRKSVMRFAFIDSLKSCCFKRNRGSHNFLITFRKHLLSEEHLFKSHIKMVLLEKYHSTERNKNTNILESFNEL